MSIPTPAIQRIQKILQENVNRYFGPMPVGERTPEKVKQYAQKQLDFFIGGLAREMPELQKKWLGKGHPYHAHLRMKPDTHLFEIEISCDE